MYGFDAPHGDKKGDWRLALSMDDALQEAVRVSERVLDHQLESLVAERGDLERLMRLGVAALAGTLAIAGLMLQAGVDAGPAVGLLAVGVLLQSVATATASRAARPLEATTVPDLKGIYHAVGEGGWSTRELRRSLLEVATVAQRYNTRSLEATVRRVRTASLLLFTGAGCVVAGMAYVVGGAIFA